MSTPSENDAQQRLRSWAGSVKRLIAAAPIQAVIDETGIAYRNHSTPPERQAIREEALATVDRWLDRDLATLATGSDSHLRDLILAADTGGPIIQLAMTATLRAALHVTDTPAPDLCDAPQRGASDLTGLRCIASRGHTGGHEYALRSYDASMADSHSPAHSDTLDVERLAKAWANVMDGRRIGTGPNAARISGGTTNADDWQAIAAEYARSPRPSAIG